MQDLENNMDDLLRKAAYDYGLKPGDSNWDKIAAQLQYEIIPAKQSKNTFQKFTAIILLILSLLVAGGIFNSLQQYKPAAINHSTIQQSLKDNIARINTSQNKNAEISSYKNPVSNDIIAKQQQHDAYYTLSNNSMVHKTALISLKDKTSVETHSITSSKDILVEDSPGIVMGTLQNKIHIAAEKNDSAAAATISQPVKLNNSKNEKGFYLGLVAGVALNTVRYQELTDPGLDIGLVAGYRFNNRISVETGLLFVKTKYFTDGKYFSMEKVGSSMPPDMHLIRLEGKSSLFEIPVNTRYNIIAGNKGNFYASAGISSYILTGEKNNYLMEHDNTKENIIGSYKNSSGYFAAAANISIGYEFKTRKNNSIRIEPYTEIPLKGIGVGKLPVASTGLHIGFTFSPYR